MALELKTTIDLSGLNKFNAQFLGALIGAGQGGEGDAQRFIKTEAGQLAWDISKKIGPKTKGQGTEKVRKDQRRIFFPLSVPAFRGKQKGKSEIRWLFGYKDGNRLVGVRSEDFLTNLNSTAIGQIAKSNRSNRGAVWRIVGDVHSVDLQNRKNSLTKKGRVRKNYFHKFVKTGQKAVVLNRVVVNKTAFTRHVAAMAKKVGQMRASFAYTAALFVPSKNIPQWVKAHFSTKVGGKAILTGQLKGASPSITFGSRSIGVQSNPYIVDKIARAVESRKKIMESKIRKIIKGYTYDWNTGGVFKQKVPKEGIE